MSVLATTTCSHAHYYDGHCAVMYCSNYVSKCPKHSVSGRDDATCSLQPQGKSIRELRAIVDADIRRFRQLEEIWDELTDTQRLELIETARAMLKQTAEDES